jgi:putative transposase
VGPIKGKWIKEQTKVDILSVIQDLQKKGVSARASCRMLVIEEQRVKRWKMSLREGQSLANKTPGSKRPMHGLLPVETLQILEMARSVEYADLSHRILAVTAMDKGLFCVSFSSVYRVLKEQNLMAGRGHVRSHNGNSRSPVRKELTGANQRWCWDISYLATFERGVYLYLYLLLDEYSRKAIEWRVSWHQTAEESRLLLEGGTMEENILDLPEDKRPEIINDRGRQMKAKTIKKFCEDNKMPQLFARPRTPDDNPFIESAFSTLKRAPRYPGTFRDDAEAKGYFKEYFEWYNTKHYHSSIDYVTPDQAHRGLRSQIVDRRSVQKSDQRLRRRKENQKQNSKQNP